MLAARKEFWPTGPNQSPDAIGSERLALCVTEQGVFLHWYGWRLGLASYDSELRFEKAFLLPDVKGKGSDGTLAATVLIVAIGGYRNISECGEIWFPAESALIVLRDVTPDCAPLSGLAVSANDDEDRATHEMRIWQDTACWFRSSPHVGQQVADAGVAQDAAKRPEKLTVLRIIEPDVHRQRTVIKTFQRLRYERCVAVHTPRPADLRSNKILRVKLNVTERR